MILVKRNDLKIIAIKMLKSHMSKYDNLFNAQKYILHILYMILYIDEQFLGVIV